jgi:arylsulfatase A-like enzyme
MQCVSRLVWVIPFFSLLTLFHHCDAQAQSEGLRLRNGAAIAESTKPDSASSPVDPERPNIILINLDDADVDLFSPEILDHYLPNIKLLAVEGLNFTNCHVTTPLCGPSRTCLLRGQYAHRTGVKTNVAAGPMNNGFTGAYPVFQSRGYEQEHLGVWMQRAGYRTMMIGKYLHGRVNPDGLPGWDDLHICFGGAYYDTSRYSTRLPAGQRRRSIGKTRYRTVAEADEAVWMIEQQIQRNQERPPQTPAQPFFF